MKKVALLLVFIINISLFSKNIFIDKKSGLEKKLFNSTEFIIDSLPDDFPQITINTNNNPAPGNILLSTFSINPAVPSYIMMLDSAGKPIYYKKPGTAGIDFKMQSNGLFSYAEAIAAGDVHNLGPIQVTNAKVIDYILDDKFNKIDSVQCQNGYLADTHDFRILPNGNYLMMSYEDFPVDMSLLVKGGNPNAHVIGSVVQELDKNKNCVFQWRSLDYIPITQTRDNQLNAMFEHVHTNAFSMDNDGNLLLSLATTCEIVKLNMISGDILWRFGGFFNDFNIKGDIEANKPLYFTMQHDVKRLANGNILFFDNGLRKNPQYSRAVEYNIDEKKKEANLVWEYRRNPDLSAFAMGSAQRLPNGNTFIDWGMILFGEFRTATEVTPDKKIAFEMSFPGDQYSYRGLKYQFPVCQPIANVMVAESMQGNTYKFSDKKSNTGAEIYFKVLNAFMYNYITLKKFDCAPQNAEFEKETPVLLPLRYTLNTKVVYNFSGEMRFDISQLPLLAPYDSLKVFFRKTEGKGKFTELPTYLNLNTSKLTASISDSGEYVVGFYRTQTKINAPKLVRPFENEMFINEEKVNLIASPTGRYDSLAIEVATDKDFNNIIAKNNNVNQTKLEFKTETERSYFWRAKSYFKNYESNWSEARQFAVTNLQLQFLKPTDSEIVYKDSTYIIRWAGNLKDSVAIDLYKGNTKYLTIKDTLFSETMACDWFVGKTIENGSDYNIVIKSLKDKNKEFGSYPFTIKSFSTDVNEIPKNYKILNNPTNGNIKIEFSELNPKSSIKLLDNLGNELNNFTLNNNNFQLNLNNYSNGVYYLLIFNGNQTFLEKVILVK